MKCLPVDYGREKLGLAVVLDEKLEHYNYLLHKQTFKVKVCVRFLWSTCCLFFLFLLNVVFNFCALSFKAINKKQTDADSGFHKQNVQKKQNNQKWFQLR